MAKRRASIPKARAEARRPTPRERKLLAELDGIALNWLQLARATGDRQPLLVGRFLAAALVAVCRQDADELAHISEWARGVLGEKDSRALSVDATAKRLGLTARSVRESFLIGWDFKGTRATYAVAIDRLLMMASWLATEGASGKDFPKHLAFQTLKTFPFLAHRGPNENRDLPERIALAMEREQVAIASDEYSIRALVKIALVEAGMPDVTAAMKYLAMRDKSDILESERLAMRHSGRRSRPR